MADIKRRDLALNRVYCSNPLDWQYTIATDYMAKFGTMTDLVDSGTAGTLLTGRGWAVTSSAFAAPAGADFISSADAQTHAGWLTDASGDILRSPVMFGDYNHARAVQQILGYLPTSLVMEAGLTFTVASADENQSAFGFLEDGGTSSVAADQLAAIYSDGTNFILRSDADSDTGAVIDTSYHVWKIVVRTGATDGVEWFIDGTSQGTMDTKTDEFPVSFFMHSLTTNRMRLGWVHIYYL